MRGCQAGNVQEPLHRRLTFVYGRDQSLGQPAVDRMEFSALPGAGQTGAMNDVSHPFQGLAKNLGFGQRPRADLDFGQPRLNKPCIAGWPEQESHREPPLPEAVQDVAAHEPVGAGQEDLHRAR